MYIAHEVAPRRGDRRSKAVCGGLCVTIISLTVFALVSAGAITGAGGGWTIGLSAILGQQ